MSNETGFSNIKKQLFSFESKLNRLEFLIRAVLLSGSFTALIMAMNKVSRYGKEVNFNVFLLFIVFIVLVCISYSFLYRRLIDLKLQSSSRIIGLIIIFPLILFLFVTLLDQLDVLYMFADDWNDRDFIDNVLINMFFIFCGISVVIFFLLLILKGIEGDNNEKV